MAGTELSTTIRKPAYVEEPVPCRLSLDHNLTPLSIRPKVRIDDLRDPPAVREIGPDRFAFEHYFGEQAVADRWGPWSPGAG